MQKDRPTSPNGRQGFPSQQAKYLLFRLPGSRRSLQSVPGQTDLKFIAETPFHYLFLSLAAALPQNFRGGSICIQNLRIRQPLPGTGSTAPSGAMRSTSGNSSRTTISPTMETRASWQVLPRPPTPCGRIYRRSSSRSGPRAACWIWRRRWSPALWPMAPAISARPTRTWKRLWVCRPTSP